MKKLPIRLIQFRFLLAFIIPIIASFDSELNRIIIVVLIVVGVVSDILDGIIARKLNISTTKLRKMDSNVDVIFTAGLFLASYFLSNFIQDYLYEIIALFLFELITYLGYWIKFKKQPSNHSYLTKAFGATLYINFCLIIGWENFYLINLLIVFCVLSYIDGFAILFRLRKWKMDNKSVLHINKSLSI